MHLGNIHFQVSPVIFGRFLTRTGMHRKMCRTFKMCFVLKMSLNLEKCFRTFFCLGGLYFDQPQKKKKVPSGARTMVIDRSTPRTISGGWSIKLQCVLVCVWRFYFGGARIGSKQLHSIEYPPTS